MDSDNLDKYRFPKTLSEQPRLLGLPYDEAILSPPTPVGYMSVIHSFGLGAAVVIWLLIKTVKRGRGSMWLYNLLYWYLPTALFSHRV